MLMGPIVAMPYNIPVIHFYGGAVTLGAIDELVRHAITKMSHYHFTLLPQYKRRVSQLGEEKWRVKNFGYSAMDYVSQKNYATKKEIENLNVQIENFKNAIIEPENVIAPTAAPIDISIKLANLMLPETPRLKASGFKKAEIATKTAANPTKLWKPATNSGIAVIGILKAINAPKLPPIKRNAIT